MASYCSACGALAPRGSTFLLGLWQAGHGAGSCRFHRIGLVAALVSGRAPEGNWPAYARASPTNTVGM